MICSETLLILELLIRKSSWRLRKSSNDVIISSPEFSSLFFIHISQLVSSIFSIFINLAIVFWKTSFVNLAIVFWKTSFVNLAIVCLDISSRVLKTISVQLRRLLNLNKILHSI